MTVSLYGNRLRDRILDDFREFRFTWRGFFRWSAISVLALLIAAVVTLYFLDWNQMRGPVGRYLSSRMGREVRIDGNLDVELFRFQPRIDAAGIFVGNPPWAGKQPAATVKRLQLEFRLFPALLGELILPAIIIDEPDGHVVRDAGGRSNWEGSGASNKLPPIRRFIVKDGHLEIDDAVRKLKFTGAISSREESGGRNASFALTGNGTLNGNPFRADVRGGPLLNVDFTRPYDFNADVRAGETHAIVNGRLTQPFALDRFAAAIQLTGANLGDLYDLTGLALPGTPPYKVHLSVDRNGGVYRLANIDGQLGASDISGELSVDVSGKVPALRGKLASRVLSLDDLGAMFGGGKSAPVKSAFLLPDTPLHTERLRQTNADVDYAATSVKSRDFPLTSLVTHIGLQDGVLRLDPLSFGFTAGKLSGNLKIDARNSVPVTSVDGRISDIRIEHFIPAKEKPASGILEARARLTGSGSSVHKTAATANGQFTVVVPSGRVRQALAEWLGVNVISALGLTLSGSNANTDVRCAVGHFSAKNGVLTAQQFVFDTDPVRVDGQGRIDMRDETLDLKLAGKPKTFQLLRVRAPITATGRWAKPALGVDAGPLVTQGGIGAALGLLNPFAAIFAFIDPGLAKDTNCAALLTDAKARGAPVKASAVRNAKKPRD
jgi:uncharacterized protein involved in outer membrane biogenesis